MKTLFVTLALFISILGYSQNTTKSTVIVTVENFISDEGKAAIALHTADTFMKGQGIQNLESKIIDGKAIFTFKNVSEGEYALLVLHDKNENDRMDFEANGMPKESYGTSNNVRSFGPPIYEDAKFTVSKNMELTIRL